MAPARLSGIKPRITSIIMLIVIIAYSLSGFIPASLYSQHYAFKTYTEEVMPDLGRINDIFQDSRGIIWLAGTRGTAYYDAHRFHRFSVSNGLTDNHCYRVIEASDSSLWICTWNDVTIYNPSTGQLTAHPVLTNEFAQRDVVFVNENTFVSAVNNRARIFQNLGEYEIPLIDSFAEESHLYAVFNDLLFDSLRSLMWMATDHLGIFAIDVSDYLRIWEMKDKRKQELYNRIGRKRFWTEYCGYSISDSSRFYKDEDESWEDISIRFESSDNFIIDDDKARREFFINHTQHYNYKNTKGWDGFVLSLHIDPEGNIWAVTGNPSLRKHSLFKLIEERFQHQTELLNIVGGFIYWFDIDYHGNKCIAGPNGAFILQKDDTLTFSQNTGLLSNQITAHLKDRQGVHWIAVDGAVQKLSSTSFQIFDGESNPHLKNLFTSVEMADPYTKKLFSTVEMPNGRLLIGNARGGGIVQYLSGRFEPFFFQPNDNDPFRGFALDKQNDLIVATSQSIYHIAGKSVKRVARNLPPINSILLSLGYKDRLWLIRNYSLLSWNGNRIYSHAPYDPEYKSTFLFSVSDSNLVIGTWFGFFRLEDDHKWHYLTFGIYYYPALSNPDSFNREVKVFPNGFIKDCVIFCGDFGPDSALWFGTYAGGLLRLQGDSLRPYEVEDGLRGKKYLSVHRDYSGDLYFLGDEGVCQVSHQGVSPISFSISDYPEFIDMAIDSKNRKYFATSRGLLISHDKTDFFCDRGFGLKESHVSGIHRINDDEFILFQPNSITLFNPELLLQSDYNPERPLMLGIWSDTTQYELCDTVSLPVGRRNIRFSFTLPDYFNETNNRFAWKLDGLQADYCSFSHTHQANFDRLPPGQFCFQLRALDGRGRLTLLSKSVVIEIPPYFYETLIFKLAAVFILMILPFLGYRWRLSHLERLKIQLKRKIMERTAELAEARDKALDAYSELKTTQKQVIEMAHKTGMAEIATNILHNIGNVLTSAITSSSGLGNIIRNSRPGKSLHRFADMIRPNAGNFGEYCTNNPKGQKIPGYIDQLDKAFSAEHMNILEKQENLNLSLGHIREIVALQEEFAGSAGITEEVNIRELFENATKLFGASFQRHYIVLSVNIADDIPIVTLDRHRLMQILVNLLKNARDALKDKQDRDRLIGIDVRVTESKSLKICVRDNGIGIDPKLLDKIFGYGFSTKQDGHGYGLHGSANAATELGGTLTVDSDGIGRGTVFTLVLPFDR